MVNDRAGLGGTQVDFTLEVFLWFANNDIAYYISSPILCHILYIQSMNHAKNQAFLPTMQKRKLKLKEVK